MKNLGKVERPNLKFIIKLKDCTVLQKKGLYPLEFNENSCKVKRIELYLKKQAYTLCILMILC